MSIQDSVTPVCDLVFFFNVVPFLICRCIEILIKEVSIVMISLTSGGSLWHSGIKSDKLQKSSCDVSASIRKISQALIA